MKLEWHVGATNVLPLSLANPVSWIILGGLTWVAVRMWQLLSRRRAPIGRSIIHWSIPLVIGLTLALTFGTLAADARYATGWTLTSQNLDAIRGQTTCGLADWTTMTSFSTITFCCSVVFRLPAS